MPFAYREEGGKNMDRKEFLLSIGVAAVTLGLPAPSLVFSKEERRKVASLRQIKPLEPLYFNYPDDNSPAVLIDVGEPVYMGVGPKRSLVAFSNLCQHMGCPLNFEKDSQLLVCPCHLSMFDPRKGGMCVEGPAINRLPMIALEVKDGDVYAVSVAYGLIYGRAKNF